MALDFPDSPSVNDTFSSGSRVWVWDGTKWDIQAADGITSYSIVGSFHGGGNPLSSGETCLVHIKRDLTITGWTIFNDVSGSITYDVWVDSYANYPPTVADSIVASAAPAVSSAVKNASTTLTGWTTSLSAGDVVMFSLDTVDGVVGVSQLVLDVDVA